MRSIAAASAIPATARWRARLANGQPGARVPRPYSADSVGGRPADVPEHVHAA